MEGGCPGQPHITPQEAHFAPHSTLLQLHYFIKNSSPFHMVVLLATLRDAVGLFSVYLKITILYNAV
jgi:hypothetical protein